MPPCCVSPRVSAKREGSNRRGGAWYKQMKPILFFSIEISVIIPGEYTFVRVDWGGEAS